MINDYVISWRSTTSERAGHGKKLMAREDAETLAAELNKDYPAFIHEAVRVNEAQNATVLAEAA